MSPIASDLLDEIERYLARTGTAKTRLGREALGDKNFVDQLRAGRDPHASTIDRVRAYMHQKRRRASD